MNKKTIQLVYILDRSASMGTVRDEVINGFNTYIRDLRGSDVNYEVTLVQFDQTGSIPTPRWKPMVQSESRWSQPTHLNEAYEIEENGHRIVNPIGGTMLEYVYTRLPIARVPDLNRDTYVPRGNTPLNDAIGFVVEELERNVRSSDPILVTIMTDGQENASYQFKTLQIKNMMKDLEARGNWTFAFLGANVDEFAIMRDYGFREGNITTWESNRQGTTDAFLRQSASTRNYGATVTSGTANSVSDFYQTAGTPGTTLTMPWASPYQANPTINNDPGDEQPDDEDDENGVPV